MKIRSIKAHSGRTLSCTGLPYNNVRPGIELIADLEDGDDPAEKMRELHVMAESMLEDHCDELIAFAHARHQQRKKPKQRTEAAAV